MFKPITSEITLKTGMILQEIGSGSEFKLGLKLNDGSDRWHIKEVGNPNANDLILDRQTLSMKYFVEED